MARSCLSPLLLLCILCDCGTGSVGFDDTGAFVQVNYRKEPPGGPRGVNPGVPVVKKGELYFGLLHCSFGDHGLRINMTDFPKTVEMHIWPLPRMDMASGRWCHPITTCHATFEEDGIAYDYNWFNFTPSTGASQIMNQECNALPFKLSGYSSGYLDEPMLTGMVDPPVKIRADYDTVDDGRRSAGCLQEDAWIESHGYSVTCKAFELHKCVGKAPEPQQKLIYAIETMTSLHPGTDDMGEVHAEDKVKSIREHPLFYSMFGPQATRNVTEIYCAPEARAIETAALAFGLENTTRIVLDIDLIDYRHKLEREHFMEAINRVTATGFMLAPMAADLVQQYDVLWGQMEEDPKHALPPVADRLMSWRYKISQKKDKRFVVVAHRNFFRLAGDVLVPADFVAPYVMDSSHPFQLQPFEPRCWESM